MNGGDPLYYSYMENNNREALMNSLISCALSCEKCAELCLSSTGKEMRHCITLTYDCADVCMQAVRYLQRKSPITLSYLQICSQMCRLCAKECKKHDICIACADACFLCAEECESYEVINA